LDGIAIEFRNISIGGISSKQNVQFPVIIKIRNGCRTLTVTRKNYPGLFCKSIVAIIPVKFGDIKPYIVDICLPCNQNVK